MFDGIDTGKNRSLDTLIAVRVCRYLAAMGVRFVDNGLHLFQRVLGLADFRAFREYAARRTELGQVDAVLDVLADLAANLPGTIGDTITAFLERGIQRVVVTMSARDTKAGPRHGHTRPGDLAGVNRVADCNVSVIACADIANRRKPCE